MTKWRLKSADANGERKVRRIRDRRADTLALAQYNGGL